jgi:hypothetical protein
MIIFRGTPSYYDFKDMPNFSIQLIREEKLIIREIEIYIKDVEGN